MGIILSALAAAGDAGVQSMNQNIDQQNRLDYLNQQNQLEQERDKQRLELEKQKMQYAEDLKNAPLTRLGIIAQRMQNQEVPVDAAPVTQLDQAGASGAGLESGIQGSMSDISKLSAQARATLANPDATDSQKQDAQGILDQLNDQLAAQKQAAVDAVKGQTRKRTADESLDAAIKEAKTSDLPAYIAGKSLAEDRYMNVPSGAQIYDKTTGKIVLSNTDAANIRAEGLQARIDMLRDNNIMNNETKKEIAELKAALKTNSGGVDNELGLKYITSLDHDQTNEKALLVAAMNQRAAANPKDYAAIDAQIEMHKGNIRDIQAQKAAWFKGMGITNVDPSKTVTPGQPSNNQPAGSLDSLFPKKK